MSLERNGTPFIAQCDFCSEYLETDESEFMAAVETLKKAGWKVFKKTGEWFHKCGCCQAEDAGHDFVDET